MRVRLWGTWSISLSAESMVSDVEYSFVLCRGLELLLLDIYRTRDKQPMLHCLSIVTLI